MRGSSIADFLKSHLRTPKTQLGILLTAIFATAFLKMLSPTLFMVYALSLLGTALPDLLFLKIRKIPLYFPSAALVTGVIITLVLAPNPPWYQPIIVGTLAMASKHFIRFARHVFNPAGFGLLVGSLLFKTPISWWAVSWQQLMIYDLRSIIFFLILLSPALVSFFRLRKYPMIVTFLFAYLLLNEIFNFQFSIFNLFDPTVLFFSLVMLPEPTTSPTRVLPQILYGTFVAVVSLFVWFPISNWVPDPFITTLLLGNLAFFKWR